MDLTANRISGCQQRDDIDLRQEGLARAWSAPKLRRIAALDTEGKLFNGGESGLTTGLS
jgi:hypothetical protein